MAIRKEILVIIIIFLVLLAAFFVFFINPSKPADLDQYDGNGLDNNEIIPSYDASADEIPQVQSNFDRTPWDENNTTDGSAPKSGRPVIMNVGINIGTWDKTTNRAGDFFFDDTEYVNDKMFAEYGELVVNDLGRKLLPHPTYWLPEGTELVAVADGTVQQIDFLEQLGDYGVLIMPKDAPQWTINYEHVSNVKVHEGQQVLAGDVIAEVSMHGDMGMAELMIFRGGATPADIVSVCPYLLLDPNVKEQYDQKILQLAADWEEFKGKDIYDESAWISPGCLYENMTEVEASSGSVP